MATTVTASTIGETDMREFGIDPELEAKADKLIKDSAKRTKKPDGTPFIRANGRGFQ